MKEDEHDAGRMVQYLTFDLSGELYGVRVADVEVVLETPRITRVPKSPVHLRGVINHRGSVIPVVDLCSIFNCAESVLSDNSSVIVTQIHYEDELITTGVLTNEVHEVVDLAEDQIESSPSYGRRIENSFISGIGKQNENFIILLDLERALSVAVNDGTNAS